MAKNKTQTAKPNVSVDNTEDKAVQSGTPDVNTVKDEQVDLNRDPIQPEVSTEPAPEVTVDKYADSATKDPDESYTIVSNILKSNATLDEKLEEISQKAHISYKAIVEQFKDYDKAYREEQLIADPIKFAKTTSDLYKTLVKILNQHDTYVCFLQLQIVIMLFNKFRTTSLHAVAYSIYDDSFFGTEEDYQEFQFIMATLGIIASEPNRQKIFKQVNFNKPEFKHGKKLEEFFRTIYL